MDLNELGRPLPHVVARLKTKNSRNGRSDDESIFREPGWQLQSGIGIAAGLTPSRDHVSSKLFQAWALRKKFPCRVVTIFVKDRAAAVMSDSGNFFHKQFRIGYETEHPTAPNEIKRYSRQSLVHQVQLVG